MRPPYQTVGSSLRGQVPFVKGQAYKGLAQALFGQGLASAFKPCYPNLNHDPDPPHH